MIEIALYQPEIPPNTGNIIRLCANTGAPLHIIHPSAFTWDDKRLRRAGLDYHEFAKIAHHEDISAFRNALSADQRLFVMTTKGSTKAYRSWQARSGDVLLFGPESRGLPEDLIFSLPVDQRLRLPMREQSRSLNLSNSVAIGLYHGWAMLDYPHGE